VSNKGGLAYLDEGARFYTTSEGRQMYRELKEGNEKFQPFETHSQIYVLALAIGILSNDKVDVKEKLDETLFVYPVYLNQDEYGVFPLMLKSMHPELDNAGIEDIMNRYAEAGLRYLYKKYKDNQTIDFQEVLKLRPKQ